MAPYLFCLNKKHNSLKKELDEAFPNVTFLSADYHPLGYMSTWRLDETLRQEMETEIRNKITELLSIKEGK